MTQQLRRAVALTLLGATLAACALPGQAAGPTPAPTLAATAPVATVAPAVTQPAATARPTGPAVTVQPVPPTAATMPTPVPTAAGAMPTVAPKPTVWGAEPTAVPPLPQPIIGFNPKGGPAGTRVDLFGSGYAPGQPVVVRLGLPAATGEVLASAWAGNDGRWSASLVVPDRLPSGELITTSDMYLVAMNDRNQALASARFGFVPPQPGPAPDFASGFVTVADMLRTWQSGGNVRPFLAANLRSQIDAGRPTDQLVGLHPIAMRGFIADRHRYAADGSLVVTFYLDYTSFVEVRSFSLYVEGGQWRVGGSALDGPQPSPVLPGDELQAVDLFLGAARTDRRMTNASFYLAATLRDKVRQGQITDVGAILIEQNPYQSYTVDRVVATNGDTALVQATLYYGPGPGYARIFELNRRDGGFWRIASVTIPAPTPTAVPPTAVPPTLAPYPAP